MCGISGFVAEGEANAGLLRRMCDAIQHRGPDGYGELVEGRVALGHRRLSIIDLAGGTQPMGNEDGSLQVIFNGEIYNYLELREDLSARGHIFATHSDTEVLVHLYEEYGEAMCEHLNGMFAFAIWDRSRQELYLARDRYGKKPLYYSTAVPGYRIAFASEMKALTAMPGFPREAAPASVADFLAFSYVPDPATIYRHARKLPPASTLLVREQAAAPRRYWSLQLHEGPAMPTEQVCESISDLAADAVNRRLMSDVPLGAFLSGGVDSSAIVAYMSRYSSQVKTFSIGFTERAFDETKYAQMVATRYKTGHLEETVTPSIDEMLGVLLHHFDEPFGDSSAIPTLYLSRMTRKHVTVALSGDGADEIFGGYRRYTWGVAEQRMRERFPSWFRHSVCRMGGRYYPKLDFLPRVFRAKTLLGNLALETGDAYFTSMTTFRDESLRNILSPELHASLGGYDPRQVYRERFQRHSHLPPLQQMQAVDMETYLPGDILVKADRATMAYSLEGRSPWLDYRLGELAAQLPQSLKVQGLTGKWILKKALEPLVHADILWRPKMGFSVPLAHWFRTSLKPAFDSMVLAPGMAEYIQLDEARRLWQEHQSGLSDHSRKLWNILMLAGWRQTHG